MWMKYAHTFQKRVRDEKNVHKNCDTTKNLLNLNANKLLSCIILF